MENILFQVTPVPASTPASTPASAPASAPTDVLLTEPAQSTYKWIMVSATPLPHQAASIDTLANLAKQHRMIGIVPCEQLLLQTAMLPGRQQRKLRLAIPYALEDQVAEDVEELHFALGRERIEANGPGFNTFVPVAIMRRDTLQHIISSWQTQKINLQALLPDVLCLPWTENQWSVWQEEQRILIRTGLHEGLATTPDNLALTLSALQTQYGTPASIHCWGNSNSAWPAIEGLPALELHATPTDPWILWASTYTPTAFNLLQGDFAAQKNHSKNPRAWKLPLILAASWIALMFVSLVIEYTLLNHERDKLEAEISDIFITTFPGSNPINPRFRMEQKLKELGGSASSVFLSLLKPLSVALQSNPQIRQKIVIDTIEFSGEQLDLSVSANDLQAVEELRQTLNERYSLKTDMGTVSNNANKISVTLRIHHS
ncbi:MAG: type II secretion system protein GspL [Gammaproteobacteria bacterium]|nr:type II secretion system protein GspL [Gammaproteobacteria bacterium]